MEAGKLARNIADRAADRIAVNTSIDDFADRELVIEHVSEIEVLKVEFFTKLDPIVAPGAVLATNTSSIPVSRLANVTANPGRVVGVHFFNPVPVLPLVEIAATLKTDRAVVNTVTAYARDVVAAHGRCRVPGPQYRPRVLQLLTARSNPFLVHQVLVPALPACAPGPGRGAGPGTLRTWPALVVGPPATVRRRPF
ncbi:3-hydroxyacyl-CoA dehydrogenase NAD-binding domain-containing protein [Nocardia sp. NPDC059246]|uniref:3-hydroxyacyl-CoA dehydrogenase NAD-binding domain-containing protein n=1 Tax=unclassified Nocardia TaxID=2637762 RepID=UPI00367D7D52